MNKVNRRRAACRHFAKQNPGEGRIHSARRTMGTGAPMKLASWGDKRNKNAELSARSLAIIDQIKEEVLL